MAEILTGRVEGNRIALDEALSELDGRRVRVTIEPLEEPDPAAPSDAAQRRRWTGEAEMRWLEEHRAQYAGQWIALDGARLLASGSTAREVYAAAHAQGVEAPFVDLVEPESGDGFWGGWL